MARVIFIRDGGTEEDPRFRLLDAEDVKAVKGLNHIITDTKGIKALITNLQMRSIHLYFSILSDALNAAGLDMKAVMAKLSKNAMIPWSASAVKERLWRPVIIDTYGKESTTELETEEVSGAYEALNLVTVEQLGIVVSFTDKYTLIEQQLRKQ